MELELVFGDEFEVLSPHDRTIVMLSVLERVSQDILDSYLEEEITLDQYKNVIKQMFLEAALLMKTLNTKDKENEAKRLH